MTTAVFIERTGAAGPVNGINPGRAAAPAFADLDGDLALVVGKDSGHFRCFENVGNARSPTFVQRTGDANPSAALTREATPRR